MIRPTQHVPPRPRRRDGEGLIVLLLIYGLLSLGLLWTLLPGGSP